MGKSPEMPKLQRFRWPRRFWAKCSARAPAQRLAVKQRAREPAEQLRLRFGGIEMPQGDQAVRPGQFETRGRRWSGPDISPRGAARLARAGAAGDENDAGAFLGRDAYGAPDGQGRVQHGAGGIGKRAVGLQGRRRDGVASASQKPCAIRFERGFADFASRNEHEMKHPRRLFAAGARAARADDGIARPENFRLDEQFAERGMRLIGRRRCSAPLRQSW